MEDKYIRGDVMFNKVEEARILRGKYVDMRLIYADSDEWAICEAGSHKPLVIGSREQILDEYDEIERTGAIKSYVRNL